MPETTTGATRRALFVSRMHPKKGVMELAEAWGRLKAEQPDIVKGWTCELVYTVSGEEERAYEGRVKERVRELGMTCAERAGDAADFVFTGALDDERKWEAYARADLFALPTYSENFGIVVAEALWAGVPVITTKGTPWKDLEERACGWWIDLPPKETLVVALRDALARARDGKDGLREMGARGRKLIEEKYTWDAVVKAVVRGYEDVLAKPNGTRRDVCA